MDIQEMFFSIEGRLNRKRFILRSLLWGVIATIPNYLFITFIQDQMLSLIMCMVLAVPSYVLQIKRLHDLGRSALFVIASFIPLVNFFYMCILIFAKGNEGRNRFGEDPLTY